MATINTIGTGLKGTTGTGSFVGATAATLSSPKISAIANAGGDLIVSFSGGASSVNRYTISSAVASSTPTISMQGTDTNIGMQTIVKGAGTYTFLFNSAPSAQVSFNGANGSSPNVFNFPLNFNANTYTFQDNVDGTLCMDLSNSGSLTTAPAASSDSALSIGTAFQNAFAYDIIVNVYLAVSAATAANILLGVGPTTTPTQSTIVSGLTLAALNIIPIQIYIPALYYALLSTSGTITQSISGQIQIPV